MAVEDVFGATTVWHSEIDPAASKVLAYRYPGVPNLSDITQVNWGAIEPVDILCGGFPCQDVSTAGRRAGIRDGTRSGLWAEMARIISIHSPTWVVIENVMGLLSATAHRNLEPEDSTMGDRTSRPVLRAMGAVLGDLFELGYDAQWTTVRASDIGAPHRRARVFILANAPGAGRAGDIPEAEPGLPGWHCDDAELLTTPQARDWKGTNSNSGGPWQSLPRDISEIAVNLRHTPNLGAVSHYLPTPSASDGTGGGQHPDRREGHTRQLCDYALMDGTTRWGKYGPAIARWQAIVGPAPAPTEPNKNGNPRLNAAFSEWMLGWPAGWVTTVPGVSRNVALRIVGNGVCPQQATAALRYLLTVAAL